MKKILVIEDEPSVRANILEILELEDYHGIGAENGLIGVLWALEHIPDLIICDVMMPELDGYGVLTTLRQDPLTATIPFIFLTAKADKTDFRQGMELGADDYLTKPFTSEELLNSIATRFEKQVAVMQQYNIEREGVAGLQQKMQEIQQDADTKDELLKKSQEELRYLLSKINVALHMLKHSSEGVKRDRCVNILQEACNREMALLNQMPTLQNFLPPDNVQLLRQLNLVNNSSEEKDLVLEDEELDWEEVSKIGFPF